MSKIKKIVTLDAETSIKNRGVHAIGKDKASPHYPDNKIVIIGYRQTYPHKYIGVYTNTNSKIEIADEEDFETEELLLVGQNIKFDLLYLLKNNKKNRIHLSKTKVWDTQLAEYLLTGQENKYASLGDKKNKEGEVVKQGLATQYGGTDKNDKIKEYWDNDIDTEKIPDDELREYLKDDVLNTELVALQQMQKAKEMGIMPLIMTHMEALLATIEMEHNGLFFDRNQALFDLGMLSGQLKLVEDALEPYFHDVKDYGIEVNYDSTEQLSAILFGGELKYTEVVPQVNEDGTPVLFKSGKNKGLQKTRKEIKTVRITGYVHALQEWETKKKGVYKTDDEILEVISNLRSGTPEGRIVDLMRERRSLVKEIGTYYKPYLELVFPDGCIHGKLNHCATHTGRLSSTSPNLQNITNKKDEDG